MIALASMLRPDFDLMLTWISDVGSSGILLLELFRGTVTRVLKAEI
jgi:hypothetical protein